jgi:DNA-binding MarR family transcriptional regulator
LSEENVQVVAKIPKYHFKKGRFFLMNKSFPTFLLEKNYTGLNYRVLFALLSKIDFNNRIKTFRQTELAEELKSKQSNISRALKQLEEDEIIEKKQHDYYFTDQFIKYAGNKKNDYRA